MGRVGLELRGTAAVITLQGEDGGHRLSAAMAREIELTLQAAQVKDGVRAVILQGAGDHFSVGADLKERASLPPEEWVRHHRPFEDLALALQEVPQPTIAAVSGWALGGGAELALGCDIVVAAPDARFGQPEAVRGLIPGMGGPQFLQRRLPQGLAAYLLYTGATMAAEEALQAGLVTFLAPDPLTRALAIADEIAKASPVAVGALCRLLRRSPGEFRAAYAQELDAWREAVASGDAIEGARAFMEKRAPNYRDLG